MSHSIHLCHSLNVFEFDAIMHTSFGEWMPQIFFAMLA